VSLDEESRREQRLSAAGAPPGRRRAFELSRLADALAAAVPSADEAKRYPVICDLVRATSHAITVESWTAVRALLLSRHIYGLLPTDHRPYYGTPLWMSALMPTVGERIARDVDETFLASMTREDGVRRMARALGFRPGSARSNLPVPAISSPTCAPERSRRALADALAELPPEKRRRRRGR
jgi:hypothetical protein